MRNRKDASQDKIVSLTNNPNCFLTLSHTRSTCVFTMTNKKKLRSNSCLLHHQHQTRETGRRKEKKGREGWKDERNTPHAPSAYSFSQANPKVFYILGEFVIVVYQERRVYISKNAGHTITDFN